MGYSSQAQERRRVREAAETGESIARVESSGGVVKSATSELRLRSPSSVTKLSVTVLVPPVAPGMPV
jgi:hypothetical protein